MTVDLQYPIGKWDKKDRLDPAERAAAIEHIASLPAQAQAAVRGLDERQLDTPYRDGGWSVRQVVHHIADSHVNAYVRQKLVATESNPPLKAYDENAWAALADVKGPVSESLQLLVALHARWTVFLRSLPAGAFARSGLHSENGPMTLDSLVGIYAWHGRHHVAHITGLRRSMRW